MRPRSANAKPDIRIEYPSVGTTYFRDVFGVYEYSTYPRSSVLAGQERRMFLDSFETLAEAQAAYPTAYVAPGTCFSPSANTFDHLSDSEGGCRWPRFGEQW